MVDNGSGGSNYVTVATYAPPGEATSYKNGASITNTDVFSPRLQPLYLSAASGSPIMQLCYDFHSAMALNAGTGTNCSFAASTVGDNGNIIQVKNLRDDNRTQNFTYDALNRIQQAWTNGNSPLTTSWGETFTIDAWGNLTNKGPVSGKTNYENMNMAPASKLNQLNGVCHDSAGNLIYTPSNCPQTAFTPTYQYDAENRMVTNPAATYVYDGDGNRVKKVGSTTTLYWYGATGDILTETDASGGTVTDYVFFNGKRVARRDSTGTVHYYFSDHLGSTSLITDNVGTMSPKPQSESDFYPYGGEIVVTADTTSNHYKFTGKERDAETCGIYCLDNFGARYDASALGRFITPDWDVKPTTVPYAKFGDPQTLNLYAYVENEPINRADADGHNWEDALEYAGGVLKGIASSVSFGTIGAPSEHDSMASLSGQLTGSLAVTHISTTMFEATAPATPEALVAAPETLGVSLVVPAAAAISATTAVGGAKNVGAVAHAMSSKETGSYTNTHESGRTYSGKGDRARSQASGRRVEQQTGDKHTATDWKSSANDRDAFKDESRRIDANGGANSSGNRNQIESPGKKYRKQDGSD